MRRFAKHAAVALAATAYLIMSATAHAIDASPPGSKRQCLWDLKGQWDITSAGEIPVTLNFQTLKEVNAAVHLRGTARNARNESGLALGFVYLKADAKRPNPGGAYEGYVTIDWDRPGSAGLGSGRTPDPQGVDYDDIYWGSIQTDGSLGGGTAWAKRPDQLRQLASVAIGPWRRQGTFRCITTASTDDVVAREPDSFAPPPAPPPITQPQVPQAPAPALGGNEPYGKIGEKFAKLGGVNGALGQPTGGEADAPHGGRCQAFRHGTICWHPKIGEAFVVWGRIGEKWSQIGRAEFGYPITDELATPDGRGRFNHFRAVQYPGRAEASIYWTPQTGAHAIYGLIRDAWAQQGWERGPLGYPTSDEHQDGKFRRTNFERGHILWAPDTGIQIVR